MTKPKHNLRTWLQDRTEMLTVSGMSRKAKRAMPESIVEAHVYCNQNREELDKSNRCGCFYCLAIYSPKEITEWVDSQKDTALCPHCGIDAVLPDSKVVVSKPLLKEMYHYWFEL